MPNNFNFTGSAAAGVSNGYCTLDDLKQSDVLSTPALANDDDFLCKIITAVSRAIDNETSRYFYKSATHEVRYFTAVDPNQVFCDDLVSITSLATDLGDGSRTYPYTWALTDYDLWPDNAAALGEPYRFIQTAPKGVYQFPLRLSRGVMLDAVFGWPAVPEPIAKACLLWSERVFKRYQTPLRVSGVTALGQQTIKVPPPDVDVEMLYNIYSMNAV